MTLYEQISKSVTVGEIADPVFFAEYDTTIEEIQGHHLGQDCFVVVEDKGRQLGWVSLLGGALESSIDSTEMIDHIDPFTPDRIVPSTTSIFEAVEIIKDQWYLFCQNRNRISGVFTYGTFDKLAFKYCLFGIALEIEDCLTRGIKNRRFRKTEIFERLNPGRVKALRKRFPAGDQDYYYGFTRQLSLRDKISIFLKDGDLFRLLPFADYWAAEKFLQNICDLRNRIAHGDSIHDLIHGTTSFAIFVTEMNQLVNHFQETIPPENDDF